MAKSLQELTNRLLLLLDEPGANPGGPPAIPGGSTFTQALITDVLNEGIAVFIEESGYSPSLIERVITPVITAGLDYALPADLVTLARVEYQQGVAAPYEVPLLTFDQFFAWSGGNNTVTGAPQVARVPFNGVMRWYPYPTATNVAAGDTVTLYYNSYGTTLTNLADTVSLPTEFQEAPVAYALSRFFTRKHAPGDAQQWENRFLRLCNRAKTRSWAVAGDADLQITDYENDPRSLTDSGLW